MEKNPLNTLISTIKDMREEGDKAFASKKWHESCDIYLRCSAVFDGVWTCIPDPPDEIADLEEGLYDNLAYSLAKVGKWVHAIVSLENGRARYLTRLAVTNRRRYSSKEESEIRYYILLQELHWGQARDHRPRVKDFASHGINIFLALIERMTPQHKNEYANLQQKMEHLKQIWSSKCYRFPSLLHDKSDIDFINYEQASAECFNFVISIAHQYQLDEIKDPSLARLANTYKEFASLSRQMPEDIFAPDPKDFIEAMGEDELRGDKYYTSSLTAIVFLVPTQHGSIALIVTPHKTEKMEFHCIELADAMPKHMIALQNLFSNPNKFKLGRDIAWWRRPIGDINLKEAIGKAYKMLKPVITYLDIKKMDHASIVPGGLFTSVPVHMISVYRSLFERKGSNIGMSYTPSVRMLARSRVIARDMRDQDPSLYGTYWNEKPEINNKPTPGTNKSQLIFAEPEVKIAAKRFIYKWGDSWLSPSLQESTNNEVDLVSHNGKYHSIHHYALHASYNPKNPFASPINLSSSAILTAADILRVDTKVRLTILSCCWSGQSGSSGKHEALGFPGLLLAAGSAGVIGALWPVHDLQASMIVLRFYDYWLESQQSPSLALASAQRWLVISSADDKQKYFDDLPHRFKGLIPDWEMTELICCCKKIALGINADENDRQKNLYNCASFFYAGL